MPTCVSMDVCVQERVTTCKMRAWMYVAERYSCLRVRVRVCVCRCNECVCMNVCMYVYECVYVSDRTSWYLMREFTVKVMHILQRRQRRFERWPDFATVQALHTHTHTHTHTQTDIGETNIGVF